MRDSCCPSCGNWVTIQQDDDYRWGFELDGEEVTCPSCGQKSTIEYDESLPDEEGETYDIFTLKRAP